MQLIKILILSIIANTLVSQEILIDKDFDKINTSPYTEILQDKNQSLEITDLLENQHRLPFLKNEGNSIKNKRVPGSNIWIKIKVKNQTTTTSKLKLISKSDALHYTLYVTNSDSLINKYISGTDVSTVDKPLQNYLIAFPIEIPPLSFSTIYIKANSDHISNEVFTLKSTKNYDRSSILTSLRLGGVLFFLILASLISIFIFLFTKERVNLYYCLYATCNAINFFFASQLFHFVFLPQVHGGHIPQFIGTLATSIFFLLFIQEFYSLQKKLKFKSLIFRIYSILITLCIILIIYFTTIGKHIQLNPLWERLPMILLSLISLYSIIIIVTYAVKLPSRNNYLMLLAFSGMVTSALLIVLVRNGIIQSSNFANHSYEFSMILEFTILSIILLWELVTAHSQRGIMKTKLSVQEKELHQAQIIKTTLQEKDTLLREIHHRVKNNLQVISALLTLQSKHIKDDKAIEALKEGHGRVESMALIHQDLYLHDNLKGVNTKDYFEKLTENLLHTYMTEERDIELHCDIESIMLDVDTMIPLGLVVNELISNTLKHAFSNRNSGNISITMHEKNNQLQLKVEDDGLGMDPEELQNKSFGFSLIKSFARRLDAELVIENHNGLSVSLLIKNYQKAA